MATGLQLARAAAAAVVALPALLASVGPALAQPTVPPAVVTVSNARAVPLAMIEIATAAEPRRIVARLARPLAPGGTIGLRLNKPSGCSYVVFARFDDTLQSDAETMDLCRDKVIRLTE